MVKRSVAGALENKRIPPAILEEVRFTISHFPELSNNPIDFVFTTGMKRSFMQAQPRWEGLFRHGSKRAYLIKIAPVFHLQGLSIPVEELPKDVLTGWLAHELGHIMDYRGRSGFSLLYFGLAYLVSKRFLMNAERIADTQAINHGLGEYILSTKYFILRNANISEKYRQRIDRLYMSPDAVMEVINKRKLDLPEEGVAFK
jgi:hypothetical protein